MNKNIEVINENLWAVDFEYIKQGWIQGLSFSVPKPSDSACITNDGKLILNKQHALYKDICKLIKIIMKFRDVQLGTEEGYRFFIKIFVPKAEDLNEQAFEKFVNSDLLKHIRKLFNQLSDLELKRRYFHAEYIKSNKKSNGINRIKKMFKRKGV